MVTIFFRTGRGGISGAKQRIILTRAREEGFTVRAGPGEIIIRTRRNISQARLRSLVTGEAISPGVAQAQRIAETQRIAAQRASIVKELRARGVSQRDINALLAGATGAELEARASQLAGISRAPLISPVLRTEEQPSFLQLTPQEQVAIREAQRIRRLTPTPGERRLQATLIERGILIPERRELFQPVTFEEPEELEIRGFPSALQPLIRLEFELLRMQERALSKISAKDVQILSKRGQQVVEAIGKGTVSLGFGAAVAIPGVPRFVRAVTTDPFGVAESLATAFRERPIRTIGETVGTALFFRGIPGRRVGRAVVEPVRATTEALIRDIRLASAGFGEGVQRRLGLIPTRRVTVEPELLRIEAELFAERQTAQFRKLFGVEEPTATQIARRQKIIEDRFRRQVGREFVGERLPEDISVRTIANLEKSLQDTGKRLSRGFDIQEQARQIGIKEARLERKRLRAARREVIDRELTRQEGAARDIVRRFAPPAAEDVAVRSIANLERSLRRTGQRISKGFDIEGEARRVRLQESRLARRAAREARRDILEREFGTEAGFRRQLRAKFRVGLAPEDVAVKSITNFEKASRGTIQRIAKGFDVQEQGRRIALQETRRRRRTARQARRDIIQRGTATEEGFRRQLSRQLKTQDTAETTAVKTLTNLERASRENTKRLNKAFDIEAAARRTRLREARLERRGLRLARRDILGRERPEMFRRRIVGEFEKVPTAEDISIRSLANLEKARLKTNQQLNKFFDIEEAARIGRIREARLERRSLRQARKNILGKEAQRESGFRRRLRRSFGTEQAAEDVAIRSLRNLARAEKNLNRRQQFLIPERRLKKPKIAVLPKERPPRRPVVPPERRPPEVVAPRRGTQQLLLQQQKKTSQKLRSQQRQQAAIKLQDPQVLESLTKQILRDQRAWGLPVFSVLQRIQQGRFDQFSALRSRQEERQRERQDQLFFSFQRQRLALFPGQALKPIAPQIPRERIDTIELIEPRLLEPPTPPRLRSTFLIEERKRKKAFDQFGVNVRFGLRKFRIPTARELFGL